MNAQNNFRQFENARLEDINYGEWTPQPTVSETVQVGQQGVTPWVNEMKKINLALEESECESFLLWIAKHMGYRFSTNVADQIKFAEGIGVSSKKKRKGKTTKLNIDQERALTGLWLWQYNEHITKAKIAEVINRHMSTRVPYVHSVAYDESMMEHITHAIGKELERLEHVEKGKMLLYPPQYTCAAPNVH